ncbi:MAG: hypothetical protein KGM16_19875 [Bacteroidota bacterium]|nr:hypothetical protein [Bacteroidota bacterium]
MARIDDVFVSGTFGNIVFYRRMGKACARMKRSGIKQTVATKKRGVNFGIAARAGKALRMGLRPCMPNPTDRSMQSRFSGAIARWLGTKEVDGLAPSNPIPFVSSYSFTMEDSFIDRCKVPFGISTSESGVEVSLAAFVPLKYISVPAGTLAVKLVIAVAGCRLATGVFTSGSSQTIHIPYDNLEIPAQTLRFDVPGDKGNLIVTAARLIYTGIKNGDPCIIDKKGFNPAGVINAVYC